MPASEGCYALSWSPNGKYLVAMAQNPSRMVLYPAQSGTWRELRRFQATWGYWVWSSDSKSVHMVMRQAKSGEEPRVFGLTIADGKWRVTKFDGLTVNTDG